MRRITALGYRTSTHSIAASEKGHSVGCSQKFAKEPKRVCEIYRMPLPAEIVFVRTFPARTNRRTPDEDSVGRMRQLICRSFTTRTAGVSNVIPAGTVSEGAGIAASFTWRVTIAACLKGRGARL